MMSWCSLKKNIYRQTFIDPSGPWDILHTVNIWNVDNRKRRFISYKCLLFIQMFEDKKRACKISVTYMERGKDLINGLFFISLLLSEADSFITFSAPLYFCIRYLLWSSSPSTSDRNHFFFRFVRKSMRISFQSEYRHSHLNPLFHGKQFSHHLSASSESQSKIQKKRKTKKI